MSNEHLSCIFEFIKKENIHTEKNAKFTYLCFLSIFHSDVIINICAHFFCQKT